MLTQTTSYKGQAHTRSDAQPAHLWEASFMPRAFSTTGPKSSPTLLLLQKSLGVCGGGRGGRSHEPTAAATVLVSKQGSHPLLPATLFQENGEGRI